MTIIHRKTPLIIIVPYTYDSMHKTTSLIVLLSGIIIQLCVDTKEDFQKLSESRYF